MHTISGRHQLHRDCPFCGARESMALVGFRASTLTSVVIDQLTSSSHSRFNDHKKLLAFSDSVQDAAQRAGFFGARTPPARRDRTWMMRRRADHRRACSVAVSFLRAVPSPSTFEQACTGTTLGLRAVQLTSWRDDLGASGTQSAGYGGEHSLSSARKGFAWRVRYVSRS